MAQRWNKQCDEEIRAYFQLYDDTDGEDGFNPYHTTQTEIDDVYHKKLDKDSILSNVPVKKFRQHYKNKAQAFLTSLEVDGARMRAREEAEEEDPDYKSDEEEMTTTRSAKKQAAQKADAKKPAKGTAKCSSLPRGVPHNLMCAMQEDEIFVWLAHTFHQYRNLKHDFACFVIDEPGGFDGAEGSYVVKVEGDQLVVKWGVDPTFTDKHHIFSFYLSKGQEFGGDSSKATAFGESGKLLKSKDGHKSFCFRRKLPFACHPVPDTDMAYKGLHRTTIVRGGKEVPVILVEFRSIHTHEQEAEPQSGGLATETFKSPAKIVRVSDTQMKTRAMEILIANGIALDVSNYQTSMDLLKREGVDYDIAELIPKAKKPKAA